MRAIFLADGNIFTTGFSRMSERQLALWKTVGHLRAVRAVQAQASRLSQLTLSSVPPGQHGRTHMRSGDGLQ